MDIEATKELQEAEPANDLEFLYQEVTLVGLECHFQEACQWRQLIYYSSEMLLFDGVTGGAKGDIVEQ